MTLVVLHLREGFTVPDVAQAALVEQDGGAVGRLDQRPCSRSWAITRVTACRRAPSKCEIMV